MLQNKMGPQRPAARCNIEVGVARGARQSLTVRLRPSERARSPTARSEQRSWGGLRAELDLRSTHAPGGLVNHFLHLRLPSWGTVVDYCANAGYAPKTSITSLLTNHLRHRGLLRQHDVLLIITPRAPSSSHSARPPAPQTCITPRRQPPLPSPPTTGSTHTNTISQVVITITTI